MALNRFTLGSQVGGATPADITLRLERPLRDLFEKWTGIYSPAINDFAFLLRIDGEIHAYSKMWNMVGAQKAKRKRDWIEVEIVVPEAWWRDCGGEFYKQHLAEEIEKGLLSMIELLKRNRHQIDEDALLSDWRKVKAAYLNHSETDPRATIQ